MKTVKIKLNGEDIIAEVNEEAGRVTYNFYAPSAYHPGGRVLVGGLEKSIYSKEEALYDKRIRWVRPFPKKFNRYYITKMSQLADKEIGDDK